MYYECPKCHCKGSPESFGERGEYMEDTEMNWTDCYNSDCNYDGNKKEFEKEGELKECKSGKHYWIWWDGDEEICIKCGKKQYAF